MSTQTPPAVRAYLARVRTALADLPGPEVDEIIDDVRPHLLEIADELGERATIETVAERLGSPESYAAELRAAGEYPAPPTETKRVRRTGARLALWAMLLGAAAAALIGFTLGHSLTDDTLLALLLVVPVVAASAWYVWARGTDRVAELPEVKRLRSGISGGEPGAARRYLSTLRPAWWVVCAAVFGVVALLLVVKNSGNIILGLPVLAAFAAIALWAGPRSRTDRRLLWASLPVSALAAGGALGLVGYLADSVEYPTDAYTYETATTTMDGQPVLTYGSETVENIYAFDENGKPLTKVYLYTEDGKPLSLPRYRCDKSTGTRSNVGEDNKFPHPRVEENVYDDHGNVNGYNAYRPGCSESTKVPFAAVIPK